MNQRFFDVKKEKQNRIINAGLKVFARAGYRHASTDEVVKTAGISKGLLFHYFESKLGLYSFLYDYSSRFMLLELRQEMEEAKKAGANQRDGALADGEKGKTADTETDTAGGGFFCFVRHREAAFMRIYRMYPYMRRFLEMAELEDCEEAAEAVEEMRRSYRTELLKLETGTAAAEGESEAGRAAEGGWETGRAAEGESETGRAVEEELETGRETEGKWKAKEAEERQMERRAVELAVRGLVEEESRKPGYTPEGLYRQICEYLDLFERAFGG